MFVLGVDLGLQIDVTSQVTSGDEEVFMNRNIIRRRLGVFASAAVLAIGLVLSAGSTAFAAPGEPIRDIDVKLGKKPVGVSVATDPIPGVDVKLRVGKQCCGTRG